jgi:hypothetical protein
MREAGRQAETVFLIHLIQDRALPETSLNTPLSRRLRMFLQAAPDEIQIVLPCRVNVDCCPPESYYDLCFRFGNGSRYFPISLTPYDCCTACIQDDSCGLSYLIGGYGYEYCGLVDTTTCSQSSSHAWAYLESSDGSISASNGNCAVVYEGLAEY